MRKVLLLLLASLAITSCATKKEIVYFQDADSLNSTAMNAVFEPVIEANDILYISVSSLDEEVILPFKRNALTNPIQTNNTNAGLQGYLVNSNGEIQFPVLGSISVSGKTRGAVQEDLRAKIQEYVTDVVVDVRIMNFKITVLGEVNNPGVLRVEDERVTLPEAIGLAGDFTEDGKREAVVVIREQDGKRVVTRVDFTKTELFSSPFYFLKQNDVVYVEPSLKGVKKSGFIPDIPALLSLVTVVLSAVILLTR